MNQPGGCEHAGHASRRAGERRRLAFALVLAGGYMAAEFIGGWWANSLALLADAGHMLSDVAALGLSLLALWIAQRPATPRRTFGYYRTEILAALVNGAALAAIVLWIFVAAFGRLRQPPEVQGAVVMAIAAGGLVVNLAMLAILGGGSHGSLNIRGAWLHVLTDALGSIGALAAGVLVWAFGWYLADPLISMFIGTLVVYSTWRLLAEAVSILMENAPRGLDVDAVRDALMSAAGVIEVHDLHVWTITSGLDSLSAHVVVANERSATDTLAELRGMLRRRFGIDHVTIQIEPEDFEERQTMF